MKVHRTSVAAKGFAVAAMVGLGVVTAPTAAAADLVGPGCSDYAAANPSGPASVDGMSQVPVTEA
ncbi:MAG: fasciclin domain-containing protein, partial [Mycobacterium sp.]